VTHLTLTGCCSTPVTSGTATECRSSGFFLVL
jgi:hypothetical protein